MDRVIALVILSGLWVVSAQAQIDSLASKTAVRAGSSVPTSDVPPLPHGKSTIIGGRIRAVDPVRDQMMLQAYGEKPMKILFDERTQLFLDGKRIPLRQMGPVEHASVQTTLDGANVFAISVHVLSGASQGDYRGRIVRYDAGSGLLTLTGDKSGEPFRVTVTKSTTLKREGQGAFSGESSGQADLVPGTLLSLSFEPGERGRGIAREITVQATPGSSFVFSGAVTALDVHAGRLVLTDPRDDRQYQIYFDTHTPEAANLHQGDHLRIRADYDGTKYVATDLATREEQ